LSALDEGGSGGIRWRIRLVEGFKVV
jgi:hypothetical protein